MRTCVAETSIQCYRSQDFGNQAKEVLTAIKVMGEACISDIAAYLNIERSSVAGRLNELKKAGVVIFVGKRKSERTGVMSEFWRAREFQETLF